MSKPHRSLNYSVRYFPKVFNRDPIVLYGVWPGARANWENRIALDETNDTTFHAHKTKERFKTTCVEHAANSEMKAWTETIKTPVGKTEEQYYTLGSPNKPLGFLERMIDGIPAGLSHNLGRAKSGERLAKYLPASRYSIALSCMRNHVPLVIPEDQAMAMDYGETHYKIPYVKIRVALIDCPETDGGAFLFHNSVNIWYYQTHSYGPMTPSVEIGTEVAQGDLLGWFKDQWMTSLRSGKVVWKGDNRLLLLSHSKLADGDKVATFHGDKAIFRTAPDEWQDDMIEAGIHAVIPINAKRKLLSQFIEIAESEDGGYEEIEIGPHKVKTLVGWVRLMVMCHTAETNASSCSLYQSRSGMPINNSAGGPKKGFQVEEVLRLYTGCIEPMHPIRQEFAMEMLTSDWKLEGHHPDGIGCESDLLGTMKMRMNVLPDNTLQLGENVYTREELMVPENGVYINYTVPEFDGENVIDKKYHMYLPPSVNRCDYEFNNYYILGPFTRLYMAAKNGFNPYNVVKDIMQQLFSGPRSAWNMLRYPRCEGGICIAVPSFDEDFENIWIPKQMFGRQVKEGDWILVVRYPVLGKNEVKLMRVKFWNKPWVCGIDPRVIAEMDGDYDGDPLQLFIVDQRKAPQLFPLRPNKATLHEFKEVTGITEFPEASTEELRHCIYRSWQLKAAMGMFVSIMWRYYQAAPAEAKRETWEAFGELCRRAIDKYVDVDRHEVCGLLNSGYSSNVASAFNMLEVIMPSWIAAAGRVDLRSIMKGSFLAMQRSSKNSDPMQLTAEMALENDKFVPVAS